MNLKMAAFLALLRGVNVSGKNIIPMANLSACFIKNGFKDVKTYIQSGNIVFSHAESSVNKVEEHIRLILKETFDLDIIVIVKSLEQVNQIIKGNTFLNSGIGSIDNLHVSLLSAMPEQSLAETLFPLKHGEDEMRIAGDVIYLNCPNGYGRTKFSNTFLERKLKVSATTRNWKTLSTLAGMMVTL